MNSVVHRSAGSRRLIAVLLLVSSCVLPLSAWALDGDSDGIADGIDNCPTVANPDQADDDHDGAGNACDSDGPGKLDVTFNPGTRANGAVYTAIAQPDGKLLIGGDFTSYNGAVRKHIARLNADGSLDTTFDPGSNEWDPVYTVVVQPDGRLVTASNFKGYYGNTSSTLLRLNADGSQDAWFRPRMGANESILALALQPDGKLLLGGNFTSYQDVPCNRIVRLNADASLDTGFNPGSGADKEIYALVVQPDGKLLLGGNFTTYNGVVRNGIARLNVDGSLDTSFNPGSGANGLVKAVALQPDGRLLLGGSFTTYNGVARNGVVRLNTDGSLDASFNPGLGADGLVHSVTLQADGKLLLGGAFTSYKGVARKYIARLNADGSLDYNFNPGSGANNGVLALAVQGDGRVLLAGYFTNYNGASANYLARIHSGDGDQDGAENAADFFPNNTAASKDVDNDGLPDAWVQPNPYGCTASAETCNGLTLDLDHDNDSVEDAADNCANAANPVQQDADGDGMGDVCDPTPNGDSDGDGVDNLVDNCPTVANAGQQDRDGDYIGDPCDPDVEGDGVANVSDNCPLDPNPDQADDDHDGAGNACDSDGPGRLDATYSSPILRDSAIVYSAVVQPDGKLLIGGNFIVGSSVYTIARLNANGSLDTSFEPAYAGIHVLSVVLQPDGKVLLCGDFTEFNGVPRNGIARLNVDGSLDDSFNPSGNDFDVDALALQPDGKVLIGGYSSQSSKRIARLNADGSLDTTFNPGMGADNIIYALVAQPDGKVLLGGGFTEFNAVPRNGIARLNADGSLDNSFNPGTGTDHEVRAMALQPDGKLFIGGNFSMYNGVARYGVARLTADGSLDTAFNLGSGSYVNYRQVLALAVQADGKLLVGGSFTTANAMGAPLCLSIARLNADGSFDYNFNHLELGINGAVFTIAPQADGRVLLGGSFNQYDYVNEYGIARIYTGDVDQDGVQDASDWFDSPAAGVDTDHDGLPDAWLQPNPYGCLADAVTCNGLSLDLDDDNDGVPDYIDADPLSPAIKTERLLPVNGAYQGSSLRESTALQ